mmetsp:Transcript_14893/g.18373  ORF Transcript_14893/g.18373 Transcript_14893/m.18373 type:complete len:417 (+) Transcript_14893:84-1334(+)
MALGIKVSELHVGVEIKKTSALRRVVDRVSSALVERFSSRYSSVSKNIKECYAIIPGNEQSACYTGKKIPFWRILPRRKTWPLRLFLAPIGEHDEHKENYMQQLNTTIGDDCKEMASYPPSPRSRQLKLKLDSEACSNEVHASCELLKAEVRALYSEDNFSRLVARRIRTYRTPPLLLSRPGLELYQGCVTRSTGGFDRFLTTRSAAPLPRGEWIYFEFHILPTNSDVEIIELSIGLDAADSNQNFAQRDIFCGQSSLSVGLLSFGGLLCQGKWIYATLLGLPFDDSDTLLFFRPGDVVGVLARQDQFGHCQIRFNVNGMLLLHGTNNNFTCGTKKKLLSQPLNLLLQNNMGKNARRRGRKKYLAARLYPTISFRTPGVTVQAHFTAPDILKPQHRTDIGAPPDSRVYTLDGTRLF